MKCVDPSILLRTSCPGEFIELLLLTLYLDECFKKFFIRFFDKLRMSFYSELFEKAHDPEFKLGSLPDKNYLKKLMDRLKNLSTMTKSECINNHKTGTSNLPERL